MSGPVSEARRATYPTPGSNNGGTGRTGLLARPVRTGQIVTTRVGLRLPDLLSFDEWDQAGRKIFRVSDSAAWCLGDWLVYGREKYDDRYRRAIEDAQLDYQTLRNYAWVAKKFDMSRRREKLSFQHHAEVASLPIPEQDHWLRLAEEHGWSRSQFRKRLKGGSRSGKAEELAVLPRVHVLPERVERWRRAAALSSRDLEQWVVTTLDNAAVLELSEATGG